MRVIIALEIATEPLVAKIAEAYEEGEEPCPPEQLIRDLVEEGSFAELFGDYFAPKVSVVIVT